LHFSSHKFTSKQLCMYCFINLYLFIIPIAIVINYPGISKTSLPTNTDSHKLKKKKNQYSTFVRQQICNKHLRKIIREKKRSYSNLLHFLYKQETKTSLTPSSMKSDFISIVDNNNRTKATREIKLSPTPLSRELKESLQSKQYQFGLLRSPLHGSPVSPQRVLEIHRDGIWGSINRFLLYEAGFNSKRKRDKRKSHSHKDYMKSISPQEHVIFMKAIDGRQFFMIWFLCVNLHLYLRHIFRFYSLFTERKPDLHLFPITSFLFNNCWT
jgi:hypothetical protein